MLLSTTRPESGSAPPSTPATFESLGLSPIALRALADEGYAEPTPIQTRAIPPALAGRDLLACAQTGTGKTAAFLLPILDRLAKRNERGSIRALVLAPTRELAAQIAERAAAYGRGSRIQTALVYGGVGQRGQEEALARRPDLLVATPGRLLDLMQQGFVRLEGIEVFVLDEADRMLDMGFIHDVRKVVARLPKRRQTLFFSATVPPAIADLAASMLIEPVEVAVTPRSTAAETVDQTVCFVDRADKRARLVDVLHAEGVSRALVFTRTKHGANRLSDQLERAGITAAAIHGN